MSERLYSCEVIIYAEPMTILQYSYSQVRHYMCIYHDKDLQKDGTPVKPHTHFYCTLRQNMSFSQIAKMFNDQLSGSGVTVTDGLVSPIKTCLADCYDYCLHTDYPDKYQYSADDIITDNLSTFVKSKDYNNNVAYQILLDFDDNLPLRDMAIKYGRDFIINYTKYRDFYNILKDFENNLQKSVDIVD